VRGGAFEHILEHHADPLTVGTDRTTVELPTHRGGP
jgi:hypothetical protein